MFPWAKRSERAPDDEYQARYERNPYGGTYIKIYDSTGARVTSEYILSERPWWVKFTTRRLIKKYKREIEREAKRKAEWEKHGMKESDDPW